MAVSQEQPKVEHDGGRAGGAVTVTLVDDCWTGEILRLEPSGRGATTRPSAPRPSPGRGAAARSA